MNYGERLTSAFAFISIQPHLRVCAVWYTRHCFVTSFKHTHLHTHTHISTPSLLPTAAQIIRAICSTSIWAAIDISLLFAVFIFICFLYNIWYRAVCSIVVVVAIAGPLLLLPLLLLFFVHFVSFDSNSHEHIEIKSTSFCSKSVNHCYYGDIRVH